MTMKCLLGALALSAASVVSAHPGHPTLDPSHTHAPFDIDPLLAVALAAIVVAVINIARSWRQRSSER